MSNNRRPPGPFAEDTYDRLRWFDVAPPRCTTLPPNLTWSRAHIGLPGRATCFYRPGRPRRFSQPARPGQPLRSPLFVSHRQADQDAALRVAWLAWGEGFDYWLDVLNLNPAHNQQVRMLETSMGRPLTPFEKSVLLAAIIEMALLNCTHVIAVMTLRTAGSQWVPYEYGRMKDTTALKSHSLLVGHHSLPQTDLPEYVHSRRTREGEGHPHWFSKEVPSSVVLWRPARRWTGATPKVLPTG